MAHAPILPPNATPWERLHHEVNDQLAGLTPAYDQIEFLRESPPPQIMPFLIWQLGLGELTPYLPQLYTLVSEGVRWQRVRGTPAALRRGLSWIEHDFLTLEEEIARICHCSGMARSRLRWSRVQIELDRVRDADRPDLERIAGIGQLSLPARSYFSRVYRGYDIRAGETGYQKTGACLTSDHSGVFIDDIPTQWSFGRTHLMTAELFYENLSDIDVWLDQISFDPGQPWSVINELWATQSFAWSVGGEVERTALMLKGAAALASHICLLDEADNPIGYVRALADTVSQSSSGEFQINGARYTANSDAPTALYVRARTQFGDGAGAQVARACIAFGLETAPDVPPGRLWLEPAEVMSCNHMIDMPINVTLAETVRDHVQFLLTINEDDIGPITYGHLLQ